MFKKFTRLVLLLIIGVSLTLFLFWRWASGPVQSTPAAVKIFVVPQGQTAGTIGRRLHQEGLIKSQLAFKLLLDRQNYAHQIQAGDFQLSPSMDLDTIIENLVHASLDYWITFPEGLRAEEYADRLIQKAALDPQEFILAAKPLEGHLFPDTYLIPQTASVEDIINILTDNFDAKFSSLDTSASSLSDRQIITLASLIEREAKHEQDRPLVSSVLHNRLKLGMALQIDATVQYALGQSGNWWPQNLSAQDLKTNSPYNTYLNPGLPPGPIANPGLASLQAAINPASTDFLYYVSDSGGFNHYAEDLEGHNQNIAKYLH